MHVAAQRAVFAAHDHQHLRVHLVSHHPVDHVSAGVLEALCPVDVGLFIEARKELDHDRDFLAAARRRDEDLHQLRLGAGAVDGGASRLKRELSPVPSMASAEICSISVWASAASSIACLAWAPLCRGKLARHAVPLRR
jgi:hypothetical protein